MAEYQNLIITIIGYLFGAGGLLFWFLERKKFNAEVQKTLESITSDKIDNDVKLSRHYVELLDDLKSRYEEKYNSYREMTESKMAEYQSVMDDKFRILRDEIRLLKSQVKNLKAHIKMQDAELREKDLQIKKLTNESHRT